MEHYKSVDTQDSSSVTVGFFRLITTHLCTDHFTYPHHPIACQNAIAHNNIITFCNFNGELSNFVQSPIELSQYGKLAYCILRIACKMFTIFAVLQYRCDYY